MAEQLPRKHAPGAYDGWEVFRWPEYQALRKRLGVPDHPKEKGCTIRVFEGEAVVVNLEFFGENHGAATDTTNLNNEQFRTAEPTHVVGDTGG